MLKTRSCQLTDLNTTFLSVFKKTRRSGDAVLISSNQEMRRALITDGTLKASICARAAFGSKRHRRFCRAFPSRRGAAEVALMRLDDLYGVGS